MTAEFLLLSFAIVFPGAAAVAIWDFIGRIENRSKVSRLGIGAFVGALAYAIPGGLGWIDLEALLSNDGSPVVSKMLQPASLGVFIATSAATLVLSALAARFAFSLSGSVRSQRLLGRTLVGSNWAEVTALAMKRWIHIRTVSGRD